MRRSNRLVKKLKRRQAAVSMKPDPFLNSIQQFFEDSNKLFLRHLSEADLEPSTAPHRLSDGLSTPKAPDSSTGDSGESV